MTDSDTTTLHTFVQERYKDIGKRTGKARKRRPQKPCQFEDCTGWAWARGYCGAHYQKMRTAGKLPTVRIVGDLIARFRASYVENSVTGYWEWTGWIHPKGYGILSMGGKSKKIRAHRFSWELYFGPIPDGLLTLHTCDNRKCVNPEHLFVGTDGDNTRDMVRKGRHSAQTGIVGTKLTPPMVLNIRIMFARGRHSMQNLADIYRVDQQTISWVVRGLSHREVG